MKKLKVSRLQVERRESKAQDWSPLRQSCNHPYWEPQIKLGKERKQDAPRCDLLPTEGLHLHGPAGSLLFYTKETGQHLKIGQSMWKHDMKTWLQFLSAKETLWLPQLKENTICKVWSKKKQKTSGHSEPYICYSQSLWMLI